MKTHRDPCGCRHELERERTLVLCEGHRREWDEDHARALAEHRDSIQRLEEKTR